VSPAPTTKLSYYVLSDGLKELRVRISWARPSRKSDYSKGFKILIGTKDPKVFLENKASCDGQIPGIIATRRCYLPMSLFWGGVHRLDQGDLIRFKIVKVNFAGESPASAPNTRGITVEKQPANMLPPDVVRGAMSFKFNIKWPKLTGDDTGGSAIMGYNLQ